MRATAWLAGAAGVVTMMACSDTPVVAPTPGGAPSRSAAVAPLLPDVVAGGGQASGHAFLHGTTVQNIRVETYSFTATTEAAAPQARGELEVHGARLTGQEFQVHADIICMAVDGDRAWIGARIREMMFDGVKVLAEVGQPIVFRVVDRGEGGGAADEASLVFYPAPGRLIETAEGYCDTRPNLPILFPSENGDIQVKSW